MERENEEGDGKGQMGREMGRGNGADESIRNFET